MSDDIALSFFVAMACLILGMYAFWAIRDAQRRGKSSLLVLIAVVIFFPFGLVAWLLFRPAVVAATR